jgi:hypothetical protein
VVFTGTLYCGGNNIPLNITGVVDIPPVGFVTDTVTVEEMGPVPVVGVTDDQLAQFNFVESQSGLTGPLMCTQVLHCAKVTSCGAIASRNVKRNKPVTGKILIIIGAIRLLQSKAVGPALPGVVLIYSDFLYKVVGWNLGCVSVQKMTSPWVRGQSVR